MDTELKKMQATDHPWPLQPDFENPNENIPLHIAAKQRAHELHYISDGDYPCGITYQGLEHLEQLYNEE